MFYTSTVYFPEDTKVSPQFQNYILDLLIKTESANTAQDTLTLVDWQAPFNLLPSDAAVSYDISLTTENGEVKYFQQTSLNLEVSEAMSRVWVKSCLQNKCGRDSFVDCHISSSGVDWIKIT
ncbi:hypothetical protein B566_EDAN018390 [Ephemera danica]|nr:hypothetical protein B566_EDAN018390 [Ephemera danica]